MNPFAAFQTVSKPLVARFAARPVLILFVLCLVPGLAAVVWRAKARADAGRAHARIAAQARGAAVELQFSQALTAAEVLGALARQSGGGISNFQTVALELLACPARTCFSGTATWRRRQRHRAAGRPRASHRVQRAERCGAPPRRVRGHPAARSDRNGAVDHRSRRAGHRGEGAGFPTGARWPRLLLGLRGRLNAAAGGLGSGRVDELWTQGYHYAFFAPGSAQQKAVTIAAHGALSFQDAVQQPVRAQNLEFRLALRPRGGWVNATKVALESLGVLVVSGLLCLLANLLQSRRLAFETAEPGRTQKDRSGAKAGAAAAQAEFTLAELQERLEGTARRANETNEIAQTKLKQAELSARELQTRLDATVRAAAEAAQAKQAELEQARLALAQAQQAISELQARLEAAASAESKTAAAAQARLQQDQATIADLQARLDAAKRSATEAAEASAARLNQSEKRNRELAGRLLKAETRVTELSALLQKAQADLKRLQNESARSAGVRTAAPVGPVPSEPKEIGGGEAVMSPVELAVASSPAIAVLAAPVEQTSATVGREARPCSE